MTLELVWPIALLALGVGIGVALAYFYSRYQDENLRKNGGGEKQRCYALTFHIPRPSLEGKSCSKTESNEITDSSESDEMSSYEEDEWTEEEKYEEMRLKMVFVIRGGPLKLSSALSASLVSQAAILAIEDVLLHQEKEGVCDPRAKSGDFIQWATWYTWWRRIGCAKITLKGPDDETKLQKLVDSAQKSHLPVKTIDFLDIQGKHIQPGPGLHEIKEKGIAVVAIGPAPSSIIDPITGSLKLLS